MPTPPRPDGITAVLSSMLSLEGIPVAAPEWFTTGRLGPSSMVIPCLSSRCRQQSRDAAQSLFDSTRFFRRHCAPR
jgi:hypothetical protein